MDGNSILKRLKRLSDIEDMKDVKGLTSATYPGTHCPLFGSAIIMKGIKDAVMLVIGTDECTYYTKDYTMGSKDFGGINGRCLSLVLDKNDVTFGCKEKLEGAIEEIVDEYNPKAIFLVTTCVVEVTGDDVDSIGHVASEKYNIPVLTVHTEHFRCDGHEPGMENVLTACIDIMEPMEKDESVNILGHRFSDIRKSEMYSFIEKAGGKINLQLPSNCTIDEIKTASRAKVNIVCNALALPLAKLMKERFDTPYVFFEKFCNPSRIYSAYDELFKYLDMPMPVEILSLKSKVEKMQKEYKPVLSGISYIYGNTVMVPFEINEFLISMGMECKLMQVKNISDVDREYIASISSMGSDPYVCKNANIAPLQYIYDVLKPHLYIGHEYELALRKKGITLVSMRHDGEKLGFELPIYLIDTMAEFSKRAIELKRERGEIQNVTM